MNNPCPTRVISKGPPPLTSLAALYLSLSSCVPVLSSYLLFTKRSSRRNSVLRMYVLFIMAQCVAIAMTLGVCSANTFLLVLPETLALHYS
ncbi:hypothetical protein K474DRAFT_937750 [Panus rudis PR-1116 ss-1]|nr:hypothetical protein K474DRAFT_937750 [Panus rudis PR-1116 ss-1]